MDVAAWLHSLGLEQYEKAFRENAIDSAVLPELTAEDLKDLGVSLVGHRRKLLAAIAALRNKGSPEPAAQRREAVDTPTAERRQLTVMFCDLVGSTALSTQLDPEDLREIIAAYHHAVAKIIAESDGFISRYMGDGVLVFFGYPQAHEDDAERAVRAGLGAIDAVRRLELKSVKLQARVGIATGLVVVGDLIGEGAAREQSVVGETPNLAARLQASAQPDAVVVSTSTRRLLGELFEYRDLGAVAVRGIAAPVQAWQVLRPSVVESRFEALRGSPLTRLIGRDEEINLLLRRWVRAKAGDGQVVLISGEPGIGKSRLTAEFAERLKSEPHLRLRNFCSPYHRDSPLFPLMDQLSRASGFADEDSPAVRLDKLEALLAQAASPTDDVTVLADLLSLPALERHPLPDLSPHRKKERTLEALIRRVEGLARQQPMVIVFEDAHWIDPTSCEFLDLAVERVRGMRALLIVTFRPEFQPPWTGQPQVTMLGLNRLDRQDRTTLAMQIAGGKALPDEVIRQIADRTDGVPLFIEELTKSVLESGLLREEADRYVLDRALPPLAIPATLQDSLMARLDRLAPVRHVAQIGAAIGRAFSYALLQVVSCLEEDELRSALDCLVASELVFQRGAAPDAVYTFKHSLVQDAAHSSLLHSARQQLHSHIADALETHFPELKDSQPEILAQHYAEARLPEKSVAYWAKAGQKSAGRSAVEEAASQFRKALDQLALLSDSLERQQQELELRSALGAVLIAGKGVTAEAGHAFARARELWERLGSPPEFLHVPYGLSRYYAHHGELDLAQHLAGDILRVSRQRNDTVGLVLGHFSAGRTALFAGHFGLSRGHFEAVLAHYDPVTHGSIVQRAAIHPHISAKAYVGLVLFCLGLPDQALAQSNAAVTEARKLAYWPSLATSLALCCELLCLVGDDTALGKRADQLLVLTTEQALAARRTQGIIYSGWAKVRNGDLTEGISLLRSNSTSYLEEVWTPHYIVLLAGAYEIAGQIGKASRVLDDPVQIVERTGGRWFAAELYRRKGQLMLQQGHSAAAEELYHTALSIARAQEAKLWELRAVTCLARLCRAQGRNAEARELLAPVYGWFTEGFDTPDLREAKDLLNELT